MAVRFLLWVSLKNKNINELPRRQQHGIKNPLFLFRPFVSSGGELN